MEKKPNKFIAVAYKLYTIDGDKSEMIEEAPADKPFTFISGFGTTIDDFENKIVALSKDDDFDFTLTSEHAYGSHDAGRVLDLDKEMFTINGHFDHENIFQGAMVPLQNEDGNRFMGHVLEINENTVRMDLNHPLAGKTIQFVGSIIESREATSQEITNMINAMSNHEHHCNCHHEDEEGGCCCNHEEGEHECHCHDDKGEGEHECCHKHDSDEGEHQCHCHNHE